MGATRLRNSTSSIVLTTLMVQSHMMMSLQCFAQLLQRIPRRSAVLYSDLLMAVVPRVFLNHDCYCCLFVPFDYASVTHISVRMARAALARAAWHVRGETSLMDGGCRNIRLRFFRADALSLGCPVQTVCFFK